MRHGIVSNLDTGMRTAQILIVEDDLDSATAMAKLLQRAGHEVRIATTIADALFAASRTPADILLSDLQLPDGSGFDLMRALHARHGTHCIAVTGNAFAKDEPHVAVAGLVRFLIKPLDFNVLMAAVRQAVDVH
jgi:DNA-binding response OmpR family regulator